MAALGMDNPAALPALRAGVTTHRNLELRRACLAALAQLSHPEAQELLEGLDDTELADLRQTLLERRALRTSSG
jgi:hypothetical protein